MDEEDASAAGEFEIERIPTCMIEARPKDLVPIFNYMQTPKLQQTRAPAIDSKKNEHVWNCGSELSGNGRITPRSISSRSPECMTNSDGEVTEPKSQIEGTEWDNHVMPSETIGFVNNNDNLKSNAQHEIVNNRREHLNMEAQLMLVNSDNRPENEQHFKENEDAFD